MDQLVSLVLLVGSVVAREPDVGEPDVGGPDVGEPDVGEPVTSGPVTIGPVTSEPVNHQADQLLDGLSGRPVR